MKVHQLILYQNLKRKKVGSNFHIFFTAAFNCGFCVSPKRQTHRNINPTAAVYGEQRGRPGQGGSQQNPGAAGAAAQTKGLPARYSQVPMTSDGNPGQRRARRKVQQFPVSALRRREALPRPLRRSVNAPRGERSPHQLSTNAAQHPGTTHPLVGRARP